MNTKPQSKSKTFPKGMEMGDVVDWFYSQIETGDHEVIYPGAEPTMDLIIETKSKYIITITKFPDKEEGKK